MTSSQFNQDTLKFDVAFLLCTQIAKVKKFEPFLMNGLIIKPMVFVVVVVVVAAVVVVVVVVVEVPANLGFKNLF